MCVIVSQWVESPPLPTPQSSPQRIKTFSIPILFSCNSLPTSVGLVGWRGHGDVVAGQHEQDAAPPELPQSLAHRSHQHHPGRFPTYFFLNIFFNPSLSLFWVLLYIIVMCGDFDGFFICVCFCRLLLRALVVSRQICEDGDHFLLFCFLFFFFSFCVLNCLMLANFLYTLLFGY